MATDTARLRALLEAAKWKRLYAVGPDGDELATDLVENDAVYGPAIASADVSWIHDDREGYSREEMNAKLRAIAEAVNALPGLIDENERLRTALASIKFDADYHGKSCNFQSAECHHETYREMSEIAFRALEGHDAKG